MTLQANRDGKIATSRTVASKTMATRRIVSPEKTVLEKDDSTDFSPPASEKSNIAPAVPLWVYLRLSALLKVH